MADVEVLLQAFQKIRTRIAESEIEEALSELAALMPQTGLDMDDDVLALRQQFKHAQKQSSLNLIENSEYSRVLSNISYAMLRVITAACKQLQQQQPSPVPSAGISVTDSEAETAPAITTDLPPMLQEGLEKMGQGDYSSALQHFSAYLQIQPRSWHAMYYLGSLHETLGLWDEAIYWYSETLKVNPANAVAMNNRGNIRMEQLGEHEKAHRDFSTALMADPTLLTARYNRALAAMYLSRYEDAITDLNSCIEQGFMTDTARGLRGVCLVAAGRHSEATEDLKVAIQANPENATYWATYGLCEYQHGLYEQAIDTLSHALTLNPN
ncbi:MAG: tetratricopeptide repeat protein, partial [Saprospiraceae bacterium]|nr:tetratricopeptide repeat protein [Saprospiraceae bacterium]